MKYHHLKYFLAAAEHKSFAAAARAVHIAQPAFSVHIRAFEEDLGVQLFERSVKGVRLTSAGRDMRLHAEAILRHMNHVRKDIILKQKELTGEISISIAASMSSLMTGVLFWEVQQCYPKIDLKITDVIRFVAGKLVEVGQLDFGLLPNVTSLSNVKIEPAITQDLYIVGRQFDIQDTTNHVRFKDLSKYPLIMSTKKSALRKDLDNIAILENRHLNIKIEQDSFDAVKSIILAGLAYTVVPYATFSIEIKEGKLAAKKIIDPPIKRVLSFVWPQSRPLSKSALAVKDLIYKKMEFFIQQGSIKGEIYSSRQSI